MTFQSSWGRIDQSGSEENFVSFLDRCSALEKITEYKKKSIERLRIQKGNHVLDAGCGTGADIRSMAKLVGDNGSATAIDSSAAMIEVARERDSAKAGNTVYRVDDINDLQLPSDSFDRCLSDRVLQHQENPLRALVELKRVLKPGGLINICDPDWTTLVIDSSNDKITDHLKVVLQEYIPNYDIGHRLTQLFATADLEICDLVQNTLVLTSLEDAREIFLIDSLLNSSVAQGLLDKALANLWLENLIKRNNSGKFFAALTGFAVLGQKKKFEPVKTASQQTLRDISSSANCKDGQEGFWVNDVHSQLNKTNVATINSISSLSSLQDEIKRASKSGRAICLAGGRHAMGAQQFKTDGILLDFSPLREILEFDREHGFVTLEAGIQWPKLLDYLHESQRGDEQPWGITQKQTGADSLSLGGAVSANVHGRGLDMSPIVSDIARLSLINANGELIECSRDQNQELFSLVIGGYGLFGAIYSVTLKLSRKVRLERMVEIAAIEQLLPRFNQLIKSGCTYGDFQFAIDPSSDNFLRIGILSAYRPTDEVTVTPPPRVLSAKKWTYLVKLAHTNKKEAFEQFSEHYLSTHGQTYWSDQFQMATYLDYYHHDIDELTPGSDSGTEVITELYVPRNLLACFMRDAASLLKELSADVIYGTVRLIKENTESFLSWSKQNYACVIFNLHVVHNEKGKKLAAKTLRSLIDLAIKFHGSFYLTYHKFATKEQVKACYPQFEEFLEKKLQYDPHERFQSDWYSHYKKLFAAD
jgi:ubiquinone/menaquinone biosynthesis C-methylase UbiE/FAD/FMN-containing dehydrogenase